MDQTPNERLESPITITSDLQYVFYLLQKETEGRQSARGVVNFHREYGDLARSMKSDTLDVPSSLQSDYNAITTPATARIPIAPGMIAVGPAHDPLGAEVLVAAADELEDEDEEEADEEDEALDDALADEAEAMDEPELMTELALAATEDVAAAGMKVTPAAAALDWRPTRAD